jgi:UDP-N-acetylglucosamine 4,6-dehydratase
MFSKVLIFGGTGSLGTMIIKIWLSKVNKFIVYSRDEYKQWILKNMFPNIDITFVIGDITNLAKVRNTIKKYDPSLIIVASAMKHVERCEENIQSCLATNCTGLLNIIESIDELYHQLSIKKIIMVSTDKACEPVNVYGMSKSICEHMIQNIQIYINKNNEKICFSCVRYGNVINSNGSIIPMLYKQSNDKNSDFFTLTDERMTRFYMTLENSVELIQDTITYSNNGEIWLPKLSSMKILDVMEIFSKRYNKPIKIVGIRHGEKIHESLISTTESLRTIIKNDRYVILPKIDNDKKEPFTYSSENNIIPKIELEKYLLHYLNNEVNISIIVLGSNGMLGKCISKYFKIYGYNVVEINRKILNITYDSNILTILEQITPYIPSSQIVVINCIGKTNKVNASKEEYDLINSKFPHIMNEICLKNNWKFIHVSTDCVFSGKNTNLLKGYTETDIPDSDDYYGITKLKGECGMTIRLSIIGKGNCIYTHVCNSDEINGYTNHYWSGVTTLEYAKIIHQIISKNLYWIGVRHIVPNYIITKEQLIQLIKNINGLNINIIPCNTSSINNKILSSIYKTDIYINNIDTQLRELKDY